MERLFFRERRVSHAGGLESEPVWNLTQPRQQKKIAVTGISRGAGATFVATSLAFLLSQSKFVEKCRTELSEQSYSPQSAAPPAKSLSPVPVSYVELKQPRPGESMVFFGAGLDQRFRGNRFADFFQLYQAGSWPSGHQFSDSAASHRSPVNLHKGINWVVWRHWAQNQEASAAEAEIGTCNSGRDWTRFPLEDLPGNFVIVDSPPVDTLHRYDLVIGVIDPLPAAVYAGAEHYELLRDQAISGLPLIWAVNRDNDQVNHGALKRFLKLKEYFSVPLLKQQLFYRAQYTCRLPVELMEDEERKPLEMIAEHMISMK